MFKNNLLKKEIHKRQICLAFKKKTNETVIAAKEYLKGRTP